MLKGIPAIIHPDFLKILAQMGHGDEIVIADAHFPSYSINSNVVRVDKASSPEIMAAVVKLIELDQYVEKPVVMMAPVPGDTLDPDVEKRYRAALSYDGKIEQVERYAFYERAKKAYAVVLTGETAKYGNIIIKKGVIPVAK